MDYSAEQEMEIEALQSILMDDFAELDGPSPSGWSDSVKCYRIGLPTGEAEAMQQSGASSMQFDLLFAHTPSYPDEAPLIKLSNVQGMSNDDIQNLQKVVDDQIQENMGMSMIYTLVSAAQEWMQERANIPQQEVLDPAEAKRQAIEAEEARLAAQRAHGTQVTPETFVEWRKRFDAELALQKASLAEQQAADKKARITGKQFFLSQEAEAEESEPSDFEFEEEQTEDVAESDEEEELSGDDESDEEDILNALG
ncbi:hypothetical protein ABBQ32_005875 [Trebouxia sp. C0010 RCD-2024]